MPPTAPPWCQVLLGLGQSLSAWVGRFGSDYLVGEEGVLWNSWPLQGSFCSTLLLFVLGLRVAQGTTAAFDSTTEAQWLFPIRVLINSEYGVISLLSRHNSWLLVYIYLLQLRRPGLSFTL